MAKTVKIFALYLFSFTAISAQTLCPPAFLTASPANGEANLSWSAPDTAFYGDILLAECFADCDSAGTAFTIVHDVDNNSGGWFRYASEVDGSLDIDCGTGMLACEDGGTDNFSAIGYYPSPGVAVDSRMMTEAIDLSSWDSAILEFVESYGWYTYQNDSNTVEVSTDSGTTWNIVYVSWAEDVATDIIARTVDISSYADVGQSVIIAFRHIDQLGDGEIWYIDNVRVWGDEDVATNITGSRSSSRVLGQTIAHGKKDHQYKRKSIIRTAPPIAWNVGDVDRDSPCGTFQSYNIYQNGSLIDNVTTNEYMATGLTNFTEYCFNVSAVYAEGESDTSFAACVMPLDPFIVDPVGIDLIPAVDEYVEANLLIANHDTAEYDFSFFTAQVENLEFAASLLDADFDIGLWGDMYDSDFLWQIGDSAAATSVYMPYPNNGTMFAYYNDDAAGDGAPAVDTYLTSNVILLAGGAEKTYLMLDMYYVQWGGPCGSTWESAGIYTDHSEISLSTNGGATWTYLDSNYVMYNQTSPAWSKLIYNITPYTANEQLIQVRVSYDDCGGNWAYGIGVDNVAVKEGENMSWLTISPYSGRIALGDTINVTVGAYGGFDNGYTASETAVLNAGPFETSLSISLTVGGSGIDTPEGVPGSFALHQNHPNPFNPTTNIRFDIPEISFARMDIYNILGQRVRTLFHDAVAPGYHSVQWNGKNDAGESLPSGMYMYKLHAGTYVAMEKLVLLK